MFRSPQNLRSGTKGKPVPLSAADKRSLGRSLSSGSSPAQSSSKTTMPATASAVDSATIESMINRQLSSGSVIDTLVAKMSGELKEIVEAAVSSAMAPVLEELKTLREMVTVLRDRVSLLEGDLLIKTDDLEQYQRRNSVRIFGVEEKAGESTDDLVVQLCRDKLGVELPDTALCRTHRVGKPPGPAADGKRRHRPIIVKFTNYRDRRLVFNSKKRLKGTGITIREDLTARRQELFRKTAERYGRNSTWTLDGRVFYVDGTGKRGTTTRLLDLEVMPTPTDHHAQ